MLALIPIPLLPENNVCLSLVRENQEQFSIQALRENPTNDRDHRRDPGAPSHKPHLLRHAVHPMAALVWSTHQYRISDLLLMDVFRDQAGFIALHGQFEVARGPGQ